MALEQLTQVAVEVVVVETMHSAAQAGLVSLSFAIQIIFQQQQLLQVARLPQLQVGIGYTLGLVQDHFISLHS